MDSVCILGIFQIVLYPLMVTFLYRVLGIFPGDVGIVFENGDAMGIGQSGVQVPTAQWKHASRTRFNRTFPEVKGVVKRSFLFKLIIHYISSV